MAEPLEFRFDFASPYSYFASERIDALAERFGRSVAWKPVLLGAIFKHLGTVPLTRQPGMHDYSIRDFARTARFLGLPFHMPMRFPIATQVPARAYYWLLEQDEALAKRFGRSRTSCARRPMPPSRSACSARRGLRWTANRSGVRTACRRSRSGWKPGASE